MIYRPYLIHGIDCERNAVEGLSTDQTGETLKNKIDFVFLILGKPGSQTRT
jgi:hypothetical protein